MDASEPRQLPGVERIGSGAVGRSGDPPSCATEGVILPLPTIASRAHIIGKESRHLGAGRGVFEAPEYGDLSVVCRLDIRPYQRRPDGVAPADRLKAVVSSIPS